MSVQSLAKSVFGVGDGVGPANGAPVPLLAVFTALIFGLDLVVPRGVTIATLYAFVVVLSLWSRNRWVVISTTAGCCVLSMLGAWLSPEGLSVKETVIDRGIAIVVLMVLALLGLMYRQADRKLWESLEAQKQLNLELDHRVRNNLAGLDTLVSIIERQGGSHERVAESVHVRIRGLLLAHTELSRAGWGFVSMRHVIEALSPRGMETRVTLDGPDVHVGHRQLPALVLVIQELFENAKRHGALGGDVDGEGQVHISWTFELTAQAGTSSVRLNWMESGGPLIDGAPTAGVGLSLVEGFVMSELGGGVRLGFPRTGASHVLDMNLETPEPNVRGRVTVTYGRERARV